MIRLHRPLTPDTFRVRTFVPGACWVWSSRPWRPSGRCRSRPRSTNPPSPPGLCVRPATAPDPTLAPHWSAGRGGAKSQLRQEFLRAPFSGHLQFKPPHSKTKTNKATFLSHLPLIRPFKPLARLPLTKRLQRSKRTDDEEDDEGYALGRWVLRSWNRSGRVGPQSRRQTVFLWEPEPARQIRWAQLC